MSIVPSETAVVSDLLSLRDNLRHSKQFVDGIEPVACVPKRSTGFYFIGWLLRSIIVDGLMLYISDMFKNVFFFDLYLLLVSTDIFRMLVITFLTL